MGKLDGKRIAFLAADGVEQVELTEPREAVEAEGAATELISLEAVEIQGFEKLEHGERFAVDRAVKDAAASDYDGLVLPGGVHNPDLLRADEDATRFVRAFFEAGKPVGAICHGPWTLIDAGVVDRLKLTSYPSIATDLRNAGAEWVDEEVVVDRGLTTSRRPDDLPAFCEKLVEEIAEGRHERQTESIRAAASEDSLTA